MEALGWIGGILLGLCGIPEAMRTIQDRRCHVGWGFLLMWFLGEICMLLYSLKFSDWALTGNYLFNIFILAPMIFYKVKSLIKDVDRNNK